MAWDALADRMQRAIVGGPLGEAITITAVDDSASVSVLGVYQRPPVISDIGGVDYRGAAHRLTIREAERPAWCDRGAKVSVRGLALVVDELVHDGQGLVDVDCVRE